jgi:hypothetical protein
MMTVERFYEAMLYQEAEASVALDGQTWSLPRFQLDQPVWAAGRPAVVVAHREEGRCRVHRGEYSYGVRFLGVNAESNAWPYCESQLSERD